MSWKRKRIRIRIGVALGAAALAAVPAASAGVKVSGVDTSAFPRVRVSVVTSQPSAKPPRLKENGLPASGLEAHNLGDTKAVVIAVDRSKSMAGGPFRNAVAGARAFSSWKAPGDRLAVIGFGSFSDRPGRFTAASGEAGAALSSLKLDRKQGTALYDAVVGAAAALDRQGLQGRVIVVLSDGDDTSSTARLEDAVGAARRAGAPVFAIGLEGKTFVPAALKRIAAETGGSYRGTSSAAGIQQLYAQIAAELRRTWRVEYLTSSRPGDRLRLDASVPKFGAGSTQVTIPGDKGVKTAAPSRLVPDSVYESFFGTQMVGALVGLLVLLAGTFLITSVRGSRLRRRLAPHIQPTAHAKRKQERERLQAAAGLFRATERTFGHWKQWVALSRLLERSDVPLRTVEFVYLSCGAGLVAGLVAGVLAQGTMVILAVMAGGAVVPWGVVWVKGKRRSTAFENQLPDMLITLAAALKAGHSFKTGLQTIVDEGRPPASKELKRVLTEAQLGRPIDDSLAEMAARLGSKNFDFVITAVTIQRQVGGSLAGLIDMVADTVRQRQQFIRKIKGLTAMGRAGAYVLVGLPFFVAFVITIMNGDYMDPLYHSSTGHKLIALMLAMMAFGSFLLKRIVSFKG
ncbi:MAG TPA: type II secretion system F family protein [Gaiellaceae bacterium]|nr:type II secretion system F family protein [Gaiellaceae bacterium]